MTNYDCSGADGNRLLTEDTLLNTKPKISVMICTRNRGDKIGSAVESVLKNLFCDFELLVIDQSSDNRTATVVKGFEDPRIHYIKTDTVGLAKARNLAVRESQADILSFTDDDCICDNGWLGAIYAEFQKDASVMGVFGRVLPYGEGGEDMVCQCVTEYTKRTTVNRPVIPFKVLGHGNNMSFRRDIFRRVGLFIETLGAGTAMKGGEDTELVYRALRMGKKFSFCPEPLVYHDNWLTTEQTKQLNYDYAISGMAIFTRFAARMDITAIGYILETGVRILYGSMKRSDKVSVMNLKMLARYFQGILKGFGFVFEVPPTYK